MSRESPDREDALRAALGDDPHGRALGIELLELVPGRCRAALRLDDRHLNFQGNAHGGVVFSLAQGYVKTPRFAELVVFVALLGILLLRHQRQAALKTVPDF